jgi:hypothetical protein
MSARLASPLLPAESNNQPAAAFLLIGRDPGAQPGAHADGYEQDNQDAQQRRETVA